MAEEAKDNLVRPHKIIMLGGRRSGKSTVLACVVDQLANRTPGNICTAMQVDQGHEFSDEAGHSYTLPTLAEKRVEIRQFVKGHKVSNNMFVVDMRPSTQKGSYFVQIKTGESAEMMLEFVDVPGEFMEASNQSHAYLEDEISKCDIFIITLDTPFLMEADEDLNMIYNRVSEISASMQKMKIDNEYDKKLIIFCPVKCEKWLHAGQGEAVADKVCQVYRTLINSWVKHPAVSMWIMPVETAGGIEFSKFLDAKRVFRSEDDRIGELCSVNDVTGMIMYCNGKAERVNDAYVIEDEQQSAFNSIVSIPLSWYRANGREFASRLCEQPVYHMLKFLAQKDRKINEARKEKGKSNFLMEFLKFLFGYRSPFGKYAKEFSDMVDKIDKEGLIQETGDGFRKLTTFIK